MKYALSWIKEFIDIPISTTELADKLSLSGLEVEGISHTCETVKGIVSGKIQSIQKHPNADKLQITQFFDGTTTHQIVTGAQNIFEGAIVPASLPGAVLADGTVIKASELRGIPSNGMLCSKEELGLSKSEPGIWILPEETPLGVDLAEYFNLRDSILDIGILPNRGDCQSIYGLAREISAVLGVPLKQKASPPTLKQSSQNMISVTIEAPQTCPLYSLQTIQNVKNGTSPLWMQQRLERCGINPISLLVDITNYVLLEYGQPLHAFDLAQLQGSALTVRLSKENDTMTGLDKSEITLTPNTLIIADTQGPAAIAGVMGGVRTGVSDSTQAIAIEAGIFDSIKVRQAKSAHQLATESASRFEKGIDPELARIAQERAAQLYVELAGGTTQDFQVIKEDTHPVFDTKTVPYSIEKINRLLGTDWSKQELQTILKTLGFEVSDTEATVPSYRQFDIQEWPCLAEEVARIKGYDAIPSCLAKTNLAIEPPTPESTLTTTLETLFIGLGFQQLNTLPMIGLSELETLHYPSTHEDYFEIKNPLSPEQALMRPQLLPSLLKVLMHNLRHSTAHSNTFEIAKVFSPKSPTTETTVLGILVHLGPQDSPYTVEDKATNTLQFSDLKGFAQLALEKLRTIQVNYQPSTTALFHPNQQSQIFSLKTAIGQVGFIHPKILKDLDINTPVGYIELSITALVKTPTTKSKYKPLPKFPGTKRDIAILAPESLSYQDIQKCIEKNKSKWVKDLSLFDLYQDSKLGEGKKSICVSLKYQDPERTLTDEEVNQAHSTLCTILVEQLPVSLR